MVGPPKRVFTFANICSFLALLVSLGTGTAYAANTIFSEDIVNGEVKTVDLGDGAVTTGKVAPSAITGDRIFDATITGLDVAADAVDASHLATDSVATAEVATDALGAADLGIDSVGTSEIATASVRGGEIADSSVGSGEVVDHSLTALDLGVGSVGQSEIVRSSVTTGAIFNETVSTSDINGGDTTVSISLPSGAIANGRCKNYNIAVAGADLGDVVIVTVRSTQGVHAGMLFSGARSLDDSVEMKVCNLTGASSPAIDTLPVRIVTIDG